MRREKEKRRGSFLYTNFFKKISLFLFFLFLHLLLHETGFTPPLSLYTLYSLLHISLSLSFFFYLFSSLISSFRCSLRLSIIRFSFSFFSLNNIPHALLCNVKDTLSIQQTLSSSSSIFFFFSFHLRIYSLLVNVYKFFLKNYEKYSILKK